MSDREQRYELAMITLGYARGIIGRLRRWVPASDCEDTDEDLKWLDERIDKVWKLNIEAEKEK